MSKIFRPTLDSISSENLQPLYLIHGLESYYIDSIVDKIIEVAIPDFEKGFNEYIFFGKDISSGDILSNARKFPMMAERQLVVIKEAQFISDIGTKDAQEKLAAYAANPLNSTILVCAFHSELNEKNEWVKSFGKNGKILKFNKLYDSEVPNFIIDVCHNLDLKISQKAIHLLAEHMGNNLSAIANEIEKLKLNLKESKEIDAQAIEYYVGISKEFNVFELQKSLVDRNLKKSLQIITYFCKNEKDNPMVVNLGALYNFFSKTLLYHSYRGSNPADIAAALKVNPYFVRDYERAANSFPIGSLLQIIKALNIADQKSKGINRGEASELDIYKDLIINILQ